ncbi:hypothetical protein D3C84_1021520 [compost metagenome]
MEAKVCVRSPGPPLVIIKGWKKACKAPFKLKNKLICTTSFILGIVIKRTLSKKFAPSILADSYKSFGIDWSAPRKITMAKPVFCHNPMNASDMLADHELDKK